MMASMPVRPVRGNSRCNGALALGIQFAEKPGDKFDEHPHARRAPVIGPVQKVDWRRVLRK